MDKRHRFGEFSSTSRMAVVILLMTSACSTQSNRDAVPKNEVASRIVFVNRPDLKLGFTTQNFIESLPVDLEHAKELVRYAAQHGCHWIEYRDPNAELTLADCREIAAFARAQGIEIAYANQRSLIDSDFWEIFEKGVVNAAVFEGPHTIRAVLSGELLEADAEKKGFTKDELDQLVATAERAAKMAKEHGLQLVIENGLEAFAGDGETIYGYREFFDAVSEAVNCQPDTGNFFCAARIPASPEQAKKFLDDNIERTSYIHLKSSVDHEFQAVLTDNALDFDYVFDLLASHQVPYIAIELVPAENADQAYKNHEASVEYLKRSGHVISEKKTP